MLVESESPFSANTDKKQLRKSRSTSLHHFFVGGMKKTTKYVENGKGGKLVHTRSPGPYQMEGGNLFHFASCLKFV